MKTHKILIDRIMVGGREPCCGATNRCCPRPPGIVFDYGTGCEKCGHPASCHAYRWTAE